MEDQTLPEWLTDHEDDDQGTGIFLPKFEGLKNFQPEITYVHCQNIAKLTDVLAFKWVPQKVVKDYKEITTASCKPITCFGSCIEYGCICHPETKICV